MRFLLSVWWRALDVTLAALTPRIPDHMRIRWYAEWRAELLHERERLAAERLTTTIGALVRLPWGMIADVIAVRRYFRLSVATPSHQSRELLMLRDLRLAWRSLVRSPGFTISAVLTLSLGLGANAAVFHLLHSVALRPLPYPNSEELVVLKSLVPGVNQEWQVPDGSRAATEWGLSLAGYFHFQENANQLAAMGAYGLGEATLMGEDTPRRIRYAQTSANLPALLGAQPILGRSFVAGEDRPGSPLVAILGHAFWRRQYGSDSTVTGRTMDIDGRVHTVVGVMPRDFHLPDRNVDVWVAWQALDPAAPPQNMHFVQSIGRLAPEATLAGLQNQLDQLTARFPEILPEAYSKTFMEDYGFRTAATPLREQVAGRTADTLWILLGSVGLVLLLAAANVTNLVLVRSETRAREVALRQALGASAWQLVRHHLAEGVWIASAGCVLGTLVGFIGLRGIMALAPVALPRLQSGLPPLGVSTIAFMIALSAAAALLFGIMPLVRGRFPTTLAAPRGASSERTVSPLRNVLVGVQVAIGLVLIVFAAATLGTFRRLHNTDPGFDARDVVTFDLQLPQARYTNQDAIARVLQGMLDRAQTLPGVIDASATDGLPLASGNTCTVAFYQSMPLEPGQFPPCLNVKLVAPGYFRTMGIPLILGTESQPANNDARTGPMVITRALAESIWPDQDPVGEGIVPGYMGVGPPWYHVAGVTDDVLYEDLDGAPTQMLFMPLRAIEGRYEYEQLFWHVVIRTDPAGVPGLRPQLEAVVRQSDPSILLGPMEAMTDVVARTIARLTFTMLLLGIAATLALALGFVGIYSVIAYLVAQRRAEIGIRLALGARVAHVQSLVIGHSLKLAGAGIAVGVVGAHFAERLMQRFAFEADPAGPLVIGVVAVLLLGVAVIASYLPSRRAAHIDPSEALRGE